MEGTEKMGELLSPSRRESERRAVKIAANVVVWGLALTMIVPFVWMLSASLKLPSEVLELPIRWIPKRLRWENYGVVWNIGRLAPRDYHFPLAYFNSLKIAGINMAGCLLTSALAGYAFAKIPFRGRDAVFLLYLATMMIPSQVTLIPKFVLFDKMRILGSHLTLILPGVVTITGTFLMKQYFMQVPNELRESATIDGAGELKIWARVMLPLAKPMLASLALLVFLWNWNNYLESLVFLRSWRTYTITVALGAFIDESLTEYNLIMAASVSALLPVFVVFTAGQKYFVKGLTAGAVKG
jgi:multiple sugar transport system permease protein